jgi:RNA polymerase sigma factor (sigma-70 family)
VADGAGAADDVATSLSLRTSLAALPVRQRQAVVLRFLADLSIDEVAQAMQCAPGTVKSTVHAALARLRVELDEDPDGR